MWRGGGGGGGGILRLPSQPASLPLNQEENMNKLINLKMVEEVKGNVLEMNK